jgi:hypothetical protein
MRHYIRNSYSLLRANAINTLNVLKNNPILIGFIGLILGALLSFSGNYVLYHEQQSDELKNIAKALDMDIAKIDESITPFYNDYVLKPYPKPGIYVAPTDPFYNLNNGIYPVYAHDISRFDYNLSSEIFEFYIDIYSAEEDRQLFMQYENSLDNETSFVKNQKLEEMIKIVNKSHSQQIPSIRKQLKKYMN